MQALTQVQIADLLRHMLPDGWLPDGVTGAGVIAALAAVGERCSEAVQRLHDGLTPGHAWFGSVARGSISVLTNATGTLPQGTVFADANGEEVETTANVSVTAGVRATVAVQSLRRSFQANLPAGTVLAVRTVPSAEDAVLPQAVLGATVVTGLTGGMPPAIEDLVWSRGLSRQHDETIEALRQRLVTLADTVTPAVIRSVVQGHFSTGQVVEIWDVAAWADSAAWADYSRVETVPTNAFIVQIPLQVVSDADMDRLWADMGHADRADGYAALRLAAREANETWYDMGDPGVRPEVAAMAQDIEARRAAGVRWWIEEVQ